MTRNVLTLALVLGLISQAPAKAREFKSVDSSMTPRQLCDNLLQVSLRKLRPMTEAGDRSAAHASLQQGLPPVKGSPPVVIRTLVGGGMGAYGPAGLESIVAWRDEGGRWRAQRAEEPSAGFVPYPEVPLAPLWPDPNPKPLIEGHVPQPGGLTLSSGQLSPGASAALDKALLDDSCINVEPPSLPPTLPLRRGGTAPCVPDSAWWHVEIRQGDVVRRYSRPCWTIGPVGLIAKTLDLAALPSAPIVKSRADLYNGTDAPTAASLRDFFTAKLPGIRYRDKEGEAVITAVRHTAPCASKLDLETGDGSRREVEVSWTGERSFPQWISNGVVRLGMDDSGPSWIAPGSTVALQLQGAMFHMHHLCGT